jgi:hypothetical protein
VCYPIPYGVFSVPEATLQLGACPESVTTAREGRTRSEPSCKGNSGSNKGLLKHYRSKARTYGVNQ